MFEANGEIKCQAAIFIFHDGKKDKAWKLAIEIPHIRLEAHDDKNEFLTNLRKWNESIEDPYNAFLYIYSHMGGPGLSASGDSQKFISWSELADALPRKVYVIWLAGCVSESCIKTWKDNSRVIHYLVGTTDKKNFVKMVEFFGDDINMQHIIPFDEMINEMEEKNPELAKYINYYDASEGFKLAFFSKRKKEDED